MCRPPALQASHTHFSLQGVSGLGAKPTSFPRRERAQCSPPPPPYTQPTPATRGQAWSYHGQAFSPLWFFFLKACASPVPSKVQTSSPIPPMHTCTTHTHMHTRSTHTISSDEEMRSSYPDPGSTAAPGRQQHFVDSSHRDINRLCSALTVAQDQRHSPPSVFPIFCSAFGLKGCEVALDPIHISFLTLHSLLTPSPLSNLLQTNEIRISGCGTQKLGFCFLLFSSQLQSGCNFQLL